MQRNLSRCNLLLLPPSVHWWGWGLRPCLPMLKGSLGCGGGIWVGSLHSPHICQRAIFLFRAILVPINRSKFQITKMTWNGKIIIQQQNKSSSVVWITEAMTVRKFCQFTSISVCQYQLTRGVKYAIFLAGKMFSFLFFSFFEEKRIGLIFSN